MNILLTSAGRRTYLLDYFKSSLGKKGVVHAANSVFSPALAKADKFVVTPLIYADNYVDFLLHYVEENQIEMVISLFDIDLPILARAKHLFKEKGVEVIVSDGNVIEICNDKWLSYKFLKSHGFSTPRTFLNLKTTLDALSIDLKFPLIVKPRWGMASIGIYKAENEPELNVFYKKVRKEIENSYLKYESEIDINQPIIIQECLEGQEFGVDVFNDLKGKHLRTFVKRKLAMRSGETDSALTEKNAQLECMSKDLAEKLKHIGNLDMDCFMVDNKPYILEMNCRFGGGYPFTHLAGANLPKAIIDMLEKREVNPNDLDMDIGIEMIKDIQPLIIQKM